VTKFFFWGFSADGELELRHWGCAPTLSDLGYDLPTEPVILLVPVRFSIPDHPQVYNNNMGFFLWRKGLALYRLFFNGAFPSFLVT